MRDIRAIVFLLMFFSIVYSESDDFRQEGAKVLYTNHKYVEYFNVFTYRHARNSPYLTSANGSNLQPWDNNVTVRVDCFNGKNQLFSIDFKICDAMQTSWANEWLKKYSDLPLKCPVQVGSYHFNALEIPPRNFPIVLPAGDYTMGLHFLITKTKEKIIYSKMNLRFQSKKKKIG